MMRGEGGASKRKERAKGRLHQRECVARGADAMAMESRKEIVSGWSALQFERQQAQTGQRSVTVRLGFPSVNVVFQCNASCVNAESKI